MIAVFIGVFAIFAAVITLFIVQALKSSNQIDRKNEGEQHQVHPAPARGVGRMQAGLRRRRAGQRHQDDDSDQEDTAHADEQEEEAQQRGEAPKNVRKDAYDAARAARDAERETLEQAQEEEIRRAALERAKKEEEEAQKWMSSFTVEDAGEDAIAAEEASALADRMENFLKSKKTVGLEELAAEFKMRTAEVIEKIKLLEDQDRITGVMDDRGKYIYISREEMKAVANYIKKRGRIAISELAKESTEMIDLGAL
jgi:DDRGK domain-containing protein 1